jgi:hypothetical protein
MKSQLSKLLKINHITARYCRIRVIAFFPKIGAADRGFVETEAEIGGKIRKI